MATIIQPPSTSPRPQVLAALAIPSVDHFIITSVCTNGNFTLIATDFGAVYKADLEAGLVHKIAQVGSGWKIICRGRLAVSSSLNGEIHLLNSHSGYVTRLPLELSVPTQLLRAVVQTIKAHNAGVRCPEFLDDRTVISGSKDGSLRVCELSNDSLERQKILTGHTAEVRCLIAGDNLIISGSLANDAPVWNAETGECIHVLQGHTSGSHFVKKRWGSSCHQVLRMAKYEFGI